MLSGVVSRVILVALSGEVAAVSVEAIVVSVEATVIPVEDTVAYDAVVASIIVGVSALVAEITSVDGSGTLIVLVLITSVG